MGADSKSGLKRKESARSRSMTNSCKRQAVAMPDDVQSVQWLTDRVPQSVLISIMTFVSFEDKRGALSRLSKSTAALLFTQPGCYEYDRILIECLSGTLSPAGEAAVPLLSALRHIDFDSFSQLPRPLPQALTSALLLAVRRSRLEHLSVRERRPVRDQCFVPQLLSSIHSMAAASDCWSSLITLRLSTDVGVFDCSPQLGSDWLSALSACRRLQSLTFDCQSHRRTEASSGASPLLRVLGSLPATVHHLRFRGGWSSVEDETAELGDRRFSTLLANPHWLPQLETLVDLDHDDDPAADLSTALINTVMSDTNKQRPIALIGSRITRPAALSQLPYLHTLLATIHVVTALPAFQSLLPSDLPHLSHIKLRLSDRQDGARPPRGGTISLTPLLSFLAHRPIRVLDITAHYCRDIEPLQETELRCLSSLTELRTLSLRFERGTPPPSLIALKTAKLLRASLPLRCWPHLDALHIEDFPLTTVQWQALLQAAPLLQDLKVGRFGARFDPVVCLASAAHCCPLLKRFIVSSDGAWGRRAISLQSVRDAFAQQPLTTQSLQRLVHIDWTMKMRDDRLPRTRGSIGSRAQAGILPLGAIQRTEQVVRMHSSSAASPARIRVLLGK